MIGSQKIHSKLTIIVFQMNSISLIEPEELREASTLSTSLLLKKNNASDS